ncbi:MAG: hypothetical protein JST35_11365 [Armatimonadetes bacterium]|nr:hypothetical protein [Armatimonadota bacterium]
MEHRKRRAAAKVAGWIALMGAVGGITYGTQRLIHLDAFAKLRERDSMDRFAANIENVSLTHYYRDRLIAKADVGRIVLLPDQHNIRMINVRNGRYTADKNLIVEFEGENAVYDSGRKFLDGPNGGHIKSKDFDLQVRQFQFDEIRSRIFVPSEIQGTLGGGKVKAASFAYAAKDRSWIVGHTVWTGPVAMTLEPGQTGQREQWTISGDGGGKNDIFTYTNAYAKSKDTIVKAQKIIHDRKAGVITAMGKVTYFSAKANMLCEKVIIYEREKRSVFTGDVQMVIKAKDQQTEPKEEEVQPLRPVVPDGLAGTPPDPKRTAEQKKLDDELRSSQSARKYPVQVRADKIEYWYKKGERRAIISGAPEAFQALPGGRWRRLWTYQAFYDGELETLKLTSKPGQRDTRMRDSIGDDVTAIWLIISTLEDDDEWSGKEVRGKMMADPDDDNGTPPPVRGPIGARMR